MTNFFWGGGRIRVRAVSRWPLTLEVRVKSQAFPRGIYSEKCCHRNTAFSEDVDISLSVTFHQCSIPIHSSLTLYILSQRQRQEPTQYISSQGHYQVTKWNKNRKLLAPVPATLITYARCFLVSFLIDYFCDAISYKAGGVVPIL